MIICYRSHLSREPRNSHWSVIDFLLRDGTASWQTCGKRSDVGSDGIDRWHRCDFWVPPKKRFVICKITMGFQRVLCWFTTLVIALTLYILYIRIILQCSCSVILVHVMLLWHCLLQKFFEDLHGTQNQKQPLFKDLHITHVSWFTDYH